MRFFDLPRVLFSPASKMLLLLPLSDITLRLPLPSLPHIGMSL